MALGFDLDPLQMHEPSHLEQDLFDDMAEAAQEGDHAAAKEESAKLHKKAATGRLSLENEHLVLARRLVFMHEDALRLVRDCLNDLELLSDQVG